jgi:hypothetical protein
MLLVRREMPGCGLAHKPQNLAGGDPNTRSKAPCPIGIFIFRESCGGILAVSRERIQLAILAN